MNRKTDNFTSVNRGKATKVVNKVFLQLRLSPDLADRLKDVAKAGGRSLPAEVIRRVESTLGEPVRTSLYAGWPEEDQARRNETRDRPVRGVARHSGAPQEGLVMTRFIEVQDATDGTSRLINMDAISVARPAKELGTTFIRLTSGYYIVARITYADFRTDIKAREN